MTWARKMLIFKKIAYYDWRGMSAYESAWKYNSSASHGAFRKECRFYFNSEGKQMEIIERQKFIYFYKIAPTVITRKKIHFREGTDYK
jgi:hypothetical protein